MIDFTHGYNKLLIIGAGGHGKVVADIAIKMNKWPRIAFLDDDDTIKSSMELEVLGRTNQAIKYIDDYDIFIAIGNNETRERIHIWLEKAGASVPVLIHPSAVIGERVDIGSGAVVMAGVVINCYTRIGKGCIINTGATIDHDNVIEDYVHIAPGAHLSGAVTVGKSTWLGIGSTVSNNVRITSRCIIGAGAVVIRSISEPGTYVGIPARRVYK